MTSRYFKEVAGRHQRISPLLNGTVEPKAPSWWVPLEYLTPLRVVGFVIVHGLAWLLLATYGYVLMGSVAVVVCCSIFAVELCQLWYFRRMPCGSAPEAILFAIAGLIYGAIIALVLLLLLEGMFGFVLPDSFSKFVVLLAVASGIYTGFNRGEGFRQRLLLGRTTYSKVAVQTGYSAIPAFGFFAAVLALFHGHWDVIGVLSIFAGASLLIAVHEGISAYKFKMSPSELTTAMAWEFGRSILVAMAVSLSLFIIDRERLSWEMLSTFIGLTSMLTFIVLQTMTSRIVALEFESWQQEFRAIPKWRGLSNPLKGYAENVGRLGSLMLSLPVAWLQALRWSPAANG